MIRFVGLVALLCVSAALAHEVAVVKAPQAIGFCTNAQNYQINDTVGSWGCYGSNAYVTTTWTFSNDAPRIFDWSLTGYSTSYAYYNLDDKQQWQVAPTTSGSFFVPKGHKVNFRYDSGQYNQNQYGLSVRVSKGPDTIYKLVSAQPYKLTSQQQGGFVYFSLDGYSLGKLFYLDVEISSYSGLKEPEVFVSVNNVPTLERYDLTNTTVSTGGKEVCYLYKPNPVAGQYVVGVFLYGTAAQLAVTATWTFNPGYLTSGVRVSATTAAIDYYQLQVPVNTVKLVFQISRQTPGGYPIAYLTQGTVPSSTNYDYIADTNKQSYISITINNPNPSGSTAANPGNYIIAIAASGGSSGYIIQADWA